MRSIYLIILSFLLSFTAFAQFGQKQENPAHWSHSVGVGGDGSYRYHILKFDVKLDQGWHLYSPFQSYKPGEGPQAAVFKFKPAKTYKLNGKLEESQVQKIRDDIFEVDVRYFEGEAKFEQKIGRVTADAFKISATVSYQVCSETEGVCIPFEEKFEFTIEEDKFHKKLDSISAAQIDTAQRSVVDTVSLVPSDTAAKAVDQSAIVAAQADDCSPLSSFWYGLIAGLGALLAPCIFSMLPLTTAFFVKQSKSKSSGIKKAMTYGFFIIIIFDILGIVFGNFVYGISSHEYFNLFLALLFMVFAFSFFGAFEITLPNFLVNKADKASDKGGTSGIFFMALTLVLVSFSCTVPFVAGLITLVNSGNIICPLMGFTGFGLSLAIPFVVFAMFPSWLHSMPKAGGWMNTVKVTLGFLEVALAMKFLSNADLVAGWHLVSRELFIAIWIVCFGLMGIYLLKLIKFSHDDDSKSVPVPQAIIAIIVLSFTLYMIPGLFGGEVKLISGFPPPLTEEWSENINLFKSQNTPETNKTTNPHSKRCPKGLDNCFHDYETGLVHAKQTGKPIMLDFTGWTCVNCRKMEANVWTDPEVLKRIRDEYVLVSLYVDEREELASADVYTNKDGREINTVGEKWQDFQLTRYGINAQPYYVLVDHNGNSLVKPVGYTPDVTEYLRFLDAGLVEFGKKK